VTCWACWRGLRKFKQRGSGSGVAAAPKAVSMEDARGSEPPKEKATSDGAPAHFTLQAPSPILVPGGAEDKVRALKAGAMPAKLLQMDPGIAFLHCGSETFHSDGLDGVDSPVKSVSMPDVCTNPIVTPTSSAGMFRPPPGLAIIGQQVPPSPGSTLHGTGKCSPCAWHWKPTGCVNAQDCPFCHLCPDGELKTRKKAKLAARRANLATTPTAASPGTSKSPSTTKRGPLAATTPKSPGSGKRGTPRVLELSSLL